MVLKVIFWTIWLVLGFIFHGVFFSYLNDKDMMLVFIVLMVLWWGITAVISLVKWKKYRKENWYVSGLAVYDDHAEFAIGINAAENPEHDSYYDIYVFVDYSTQEADVSFNVVW